MLENGARAGATVPLRERKKRDARSKILASAVALFREWGSTAVPVAAIADACDLSEATFFNYFPSKDALLGEWVHAEAAAALGRAVDSATSLRRGLRAGAQAFADAVEKERPLFELAFARARLEIDRGAPGARGEDRSALVEAVAGGQQRDELRGDLTAAELTAALVEAVLHAVARALADGASAAALRKRALARLDLVIDGARKRNERVQGPGTGN